MTQNNRKMPPSQKFMLITFWILLINVILMFITFVADGITAEVTRTEEVKCTDEYDREFINEYCIKETKCGFLAKRLNNERCYGTR